MEQLLGGEGRGGGRGVGGRGDKARFLKMGKDEPHLCWWDVGKGS